jgi:hypothetical protein
MTARGTPKAEDIQFSDFNQCRLFASRPPTTDNPTSTIIKEQVVLNSEHATKGDDGDDEPEA